MRNANVSKRPILIMQLLVVTSLLATSILSIDLGFFKLSTFRILTLLIGLYIISPFNKNKILIHKRERYYYIFPFLLIFYSLLSLMWVKNHIDAFTDLYFIFLFVIMFLTSNYAIKSNLDISKVMIAFLIFSLLHIIIGLYEYNTRNFLFVNNPLMIPGLIRDNRVVSVFTNSNNFSFYLFFVSTISLFSIKKFQSKKTKYYLIILYAVSVFLIILNGSRAIILSHIISLFSYLLIYLLYNRKKLGFLLTLATAITIVFILIIYFVDLNAASDSTRLFLMRDSLKVLIDTYLFGSGVGNLPYYLGELQGNSISTAHNWWLEFLATFGILMFLFYIIYILKILYDNLNIYKKTKDPYSIMFASILIGFIFAVIGPSTILYSEWFWLIKSIIIAYTIMKKREIRNKQQEFLNNIKINN